jgi:hypothetical protein
MRIEAYQVVEVFDERDQLRAAMLRINDIACRGLNATDAKEKDAALAEILAAVEEVRRDD